MSASFLGLNNSFLATRLTLNNVSEFILNNSILATRLTCDSGSLAISQEYTEDQIGAAKLPLITSPKPLNPWGEKILITRTEVWLMMQSGKWAGPWTGGSVIGVADWHVLCFQGDVMRHRVRPSPRGNSRALHCILALRPCDAEGRWVWVCYQRLPISSAREELRVSRLSSRSLALACSGLRRRRAK